MNNHLIDDPTEHIGIVDIHRDLDIQSLVDAIPGSDSYSDPTKAVVALIQANAAVVAAIREMQMALTASLKAPATRVVEQGTEIIFKTVAINNVYPVKVVNYNYERIRLRLAGTNDAIVVGTDPNISYPGNQAASFNGVYITQSQGYSLDLRTTRDIWVMSTSAASTTCNVIEEFYAAK